MSGKKILSVAEIARELELPESTVHYWKNRFAQHLPSVGRGRQKRFKPEAIEVFGTISRLLKEGHTARDVMDQLSRDYPLQADTVQTQDGQVGLSSPPSAQMPMELVAQMASAIGLEIAKVLGEGLKEAFAPLLQGGGSPADAQNIQEVRAGLEDAVDRISAQVGEVEGLRTENTTLREKLTVMEGELVRLRKDRRELEKYLLDKIKYMTS